MWRVMWNAYVSTWDYERTWYAISVVNKDILDHDTHLMDEAMNLDKWDQQLV